jgi:hypothetical protein
LQQDPLSTAEKSLSEAGKIVKEKIDEITKNIRERQAKGDPE